MDVMITGASTELGRETTKQLLAKNHNVIGLTGSDRAAERIRATGAEVRRVRLDNVADLQRVLADVRPEVVLNLATQRANTLLHDGHAWRGYARSLPAQTAALVGGVRQSGVGYLVHASYAFLYGTQKTADETTPLRPPPGDAIFAGAVKAENMWVDDAVVPFSILRLGYLYGPQSRDLKLYETSFKLHRPYYAGPRAHRASWLHFSDAARALVVAVEKRPVEQIINVVDGTPSSFGTFIDTYARTLGRHKPLRIPTFSVRFVPLLIAPQQVRLLNLVGPELGFERAREQLEWAPAYADYEAGLAQTVASWRERG